MKSAAENELVFKAVAVVVVVEVAKVVLVRVAEEVVAVDYSYSTLGVVRQKIDWLLKPSAWRQLPQGQLPCHQKAFSRENEISSSQILRNKHNLINFS